ncbi:MAG: MBOAT family protein [Rhodospirillaceae bacterium]|jgi:alginate O-acetyltransferase complex protein AlgI|nr:MBOAT family protein [Rhodospirillaceae bacterium]MBT5373698.1 MBOAT family protein [Rhodospirillaceae bacterium]MBT5658767.1 MBOAT family protein [Rhodospirillaceae bacterium]MBT5751487.1 MBOAT family protein [Rhodospirillaceae bacterium]
MLFSSSIFLYAFLPISLLVFHFSRVRFGGTVALGSAVAFSLFFYGWWNPPFLALLIGSLLVNFFFVRRLAIAPSRILLILAIAINLAVLGYFKYRNFFLENLGLTLGEQWSFDLVFIPLGISFFTFQQIALLIDSHDGEITTPPSALDFSQFITFFPQLIAGPIVLYRELSAQLLDVHENKGAGLALFGPGVVVFLVGLFKKVCLADNIAPYANIAFSQIENLSLLEAWAGAVAYGLQLYFDFSGYSDMAIGLGLMFGFRLPLNFDTPFRATSMIDFWKRWHITMTRFFMMYFYSPLALALTRYGVTNLKKGAALFLLTVTVPIFTTFLLAGLWHGAGWTFVAFGAVNGAGLVANHAWKEMKMPNLPGWIGWIFTMLTVLVSFVYFRAPGIVEANLMLTTMVSPSAFMMPNWLSAFAESQGLAWTSLPLFVSGTFTLHMFAWMGVLGLLSLVMANPAKDYMRLRPTPSMALVVASLTWLSVGWLDEPRTFLYFQF